MLVRELRPRPHSWSQYKENCMPIALPFRALEWSLQWSAYYLSRWALLEVLEYLSVLSVLFAVIFYFAESGDRQKQKHYQAWQVVNTAQGNGGSGGRIEALQELNLDHVPLVGVDAAGAFLQGIQLHGADLGRQHRAGQRRQRRPDRSSPGAESGPRSAGGCRCRRRLLARHPAPGRESVPRRPGSVRPARRQLASGRSGVRQPEIGQFPASQSRPRETRGR